VNLNFIEKISKDSDENVIDYQISILKITALWAFSESAFGGILHALAIPFRGIFINGAAVLFISLIALFSKNSKEILKSTLIVMLIKALVSPHTPLTAYFAVSVQGFLGYLLFLSKSFFRISTLLLGIFTLFFSGIQKIIVLTLLFGNTLWKSINIFIKQISKEFFRLDVHSDLNFGLILIGIYILIHIVSGIFIGFYAGILPQKINFYRNQIPKDLLLETIEEFSKNSRNKKNWLLRPTGVIIIFISISVLIYSYISPSTSEIRSSDIVIMLIRSVTIMIIWFTLIGPIVRKLFQKFLSGKKSFYAKEIEEIMQLFPMFKKVVSYCWKNSSDKNGIKRLRKFLSTSFYYLLLS
jgi:hypothetical protein